MSRSCQRATFSSPTSEQRPHDAREPADPLGDDGIPLVRHRRRALLAVAERLLHLADLGAREVPDLEREGVERRRDDRERREELRMAVALEDLRRGRRGLEAEPLAREPLELGIGRGVGADRARELADAHPLERPRDAFLAARQLERPAGELEPEGRRLGMDAVRAADLQRLAVLLGARRDDCEGAVETREDQRARLADLQRERGVDDVGGGEAVVEPAALLAELLGDGVDEGGGVVVERRLELGDPLRRRRVSPGRRAQRPHRARLPARPRLPWRRARPRATSRASPRPTRSWPWPGGSSGRSRLQSRALACRSHLPQTGDREPQNTRLLWRGFCPRNL